MTFSAEVMAHHQLPCSGSDWICLHMLGRALLCNDCRDHIWQPHCARCLQYVPCYDCHVSRPPRQSGAGLTRNGSNCHELPLCNVMPRQARRHLSQVAEIEAAVRTAAYVLTRRPRWRRPQPRSSQPVLVNRGQVGQRHSCKQGWSQPEPGLLCLLAGAEFPDAARVEVRRKLDPHSAHQLTQVPAYPQVIQLLDGSVKVRVHIVH